MKIDSSFARNKKLLLPDKNILCFGILRPSGAGVCGDVWGVKEFIKHEAHINKYTIHMRASNRSEIVT